MSLCSPNTLKTDLKLEILKPGIDGDTSKAVPLASVQYTQYVLEEAKDMCL